MCIRDRFCFACTANAESEDSANCAADSETCRCSDEPQRENRQGELESLRINDEADDRQVEEHAIAGTRARQRFGAERTSHREHLRPVMLQTARCLLYTSPSPRD